MASIFSVPCCYDTTIISRLPDEDEHEHQHEHGHQHEHQHEHDLKHSVISLRSPNADDAVLGWTLDSAARGTLIMGGSVFVSTALLKLAREAAGCVEGEECHGRVYGMRPSSLLTNITTIVGILSAASMPLLGSIIDHTVYRRHVGRWSAATMTTLIPLQMILLKNFWFQAAIIQVMIAFSYCIHLCALYAYLPELTHDSAQLVKYSGRFIASMYASSVVFLLIIVILLQLFSVDDVLVSARISQLLVFFVCAVLFGYSWTCLFPNRPAAQQMPEGQCIITAGFDKLFTTSRLILSHYHAIKWFLVSVAFAESAAAAFSSIAITFMTDHLHFTSTENGIAILLLLIFGIPGTKLATMATNHFNPVRSLQLCLVLWIVTTTCGCLVLRGEGQQKAAFCFASIWGLCLGWLYPTEKVLYCTIIPKGHEAELMGVYICACQVLSWLAPLVFTIMNEYGISMRIGFLTLDVYFFISFVLLFFIGDYQAATEHARLEDVHVNVGLEQQQQNVTGVADRVLYSSYLSVDH